MTTRTERQRTFNGELTSPLDLSTDVVATLPNGAMMQRADAHRSPMGEYWDNEEDMLETVQEANDETFSKFFADAEQWVNDYVESDDYCGEHVYLLNEGDSSSKHVTKYLRELGTIAHLPKELKKRIGREVVQDIIDNHVTWNVVDEYASTSEWYLDSIHEGEKEEQIEWSRLVETIGEKIQLWDGETLLSQFLDWSQRQRDYCLRTDSMFDKAGRLREYACCYLYVQVGKRIDYIIDGGEETLKTVLAEVVKTIAHNMDYDRARRLHTLEWDREFHRMHPNNEFRFPRGKVRDAYNVYRATGGRLCFNDWYAEQAYDVT